MAGVEELRTLIRERSPLDPEATEAVISKRFESMPGRLRLALERWPLASSRVLDVGCSYGHCLAHFGPGSLGIDNVAEHVDFCRALGLDAVLADVDGGLDVLAGRRFDVVWLADVVEHLDAPRLLLRRLRSALEPEGLLLLTVSPLPRSRIVRAALRRRGVHPFDANAHYYQFTEETTRYLLRRAGFRVESVEVPFLPARVRRPARMLAAHSPRLLLAARPDSGAEDDARRAERKNKPAA